jgi:hypothetical protein
MKRQPKNQWGVIVGQPTRLHIDTGVDAVALMLQAGKWVYDFDGEEPYIQLYDTREEARRAARKYRQENNYWNYLAKKYTP